MGLPVRREPVFWWRREASLLAHLLTPVSLLYGAAAEARWRLVPAGRAACPVICIGNFTLGGGGKTPCAIATAELLERAGAKPYLLTRGYGGKEAGPRLVNLDRDDAARVGDEALLLARTAPTVVARDRTAGAEFAVSKGADAIVIDDGFQNPSLAKDLSVIAMDAGVGAGNGLMLPAGPLRALLGLQLARAGALVLIGKGDAGDPIASVLAAQGKPVFRASYEPAESTDWLKQRPGVAFAGIARPAKFFETLESLGVQIAERIAFPDHHVFGEADAEDLLGLAKANDAQLMTTEKDWVRLAGAAGRLAELREATRPLPIRLRFEDEGGYARLIGSIAGRGA